MEGRSELGGGRGGRDDDVEAAAVVVVVVVADRRPCSLARGDGAAVIVCARCSRAAGSGQGQVAWVAERGPGGKTIYFL